MEKDDKKGIKIENLSKYLSQISEIRKQIESEGRNTDSQRFFFRGQANCEWLVEPGVFRNDLLPSETSLIHEAYLRNPSEFRMLTDFEKLAKLQHYGLPTRLLDVTSNPLVALYFACQNAGTTPKIDEEQTSPDGAVFYQQAYCVSCSDLPVSVIAFLSNHTIDGDMTLKKLLEILVEQGLYTEKAAEACKGQKYKSLIEILQRNYFVISNWNNERLIRQSGSFLLTGQYNITMNARNIGDSVIQPAKSCVRNEFNEQYFIIPASRKEEILKELDFYNINEGSLFPELEHQMSYIKRAQENNSSRPVGVFSKIDTDLDSSERNFVPKKELSESDFYDIIDGVVRSSVNPLLVDECKLAIIDNMVTDWYRREIIISKIKVALTNALEKYMPERATAKMMASRIVTKILDKIREKQS